MMDFTFFIPQNIIVGENSIMKLSNVVGELGGKHAFLISGPSLMKHGAVGTVEQILKKADILVDVFVDVEPNPSVATVEKAVAAYLSTNADFIIALGGGSPMDVAKAVAVVAKFGGSITDYEGAHKVPGKVIPMIAIPTTAGTGSEVTAFSVITDHSRNYKLTVFSYELFPQYAILDPNFITTVPASVASACGIDALIHAEEAYISTIASPFSEAMSEKAMELIGGSIRRYVANRKDRKAAENMLVGSLFAGIAFSFARLGNIHAMSHPISAFFDVPHGVANGVLFPVIANYNRITDSGKYWKIYNYIHPMRKSKEEFKPDMLVEAIQELCEEIGIPKGILQAVKENTKYKDITKEEIISKINDMAVDAMKSGNIAVNPRTVELEDVVELYHEAL